MKAIAELIPWKVADISLRPHKGMWSMNPSIHFDGDLWRCTLRCADYAMPDGSTIRSLKAKRGAAQTKNVMVIFDPDTWQPREIYKMRENDLLPRTPCSSVGFEDLRLFYTLQGGLQGIAASLHLQRAQETRHCVEQVIVSFDAEYNIVKASPIRGGSFTNTHQKNWVPFDRVAAPRFLYSIGHGTLFDDRGVAERTLVTPALLPPIPHFPSPRARDRAAARAVKREQERAQETRHRAKPRHEGLVGSSSLLGLRGGSQLVKIAADAWLGIGHEMQLVNKRKCYYHVWYVVDSRGKLTAASTPCKLAPNGIEFAAGLAVAADRLVVSFGVDDMECFLGETRVSAVMELMCPIP